MFCKVCGLDACMHSRDAITNLCISCGVAEAEPTGRCISCRNKELYKEKKSYIKVPLIQHIIKQKPTSSIDQYGTKHWYLIGKLHREDGPAIECADGSKEWWINGKFIRRYTI